MNWISPKKKLAACVWAATAFLPTYVLQAAPVLPPPGQFGVASWHAPRGAECRTASRWPWVNTEFIAAHRTLPLGSRVRVINLSNGREAVVRITDRGPYRRGRVIDVSRCAAQQLGFIQAGTTRVRLEALPRDAIR